MAMADTSVRPVMSAGMLSLFENGRRPRAVLMVPDVFELDLHVGNDATTLCKATGGASHASNGWIGA